MAAILPYIKNIFRPVGLWIIMLAVLQACTERIDLATEEEFQKLAVEGYITPEKQEVKLTETSGYFSQMAPKPVREAVVTVSYSTGTFQFNESPDKPGYYYPEDNFEVIQEESYSLSIDLKEPIGGETNFESQATMPRRANAVDSTRAIWREEFETWIIELYAFEPEGPDYYMFNAYVNGVAVTDSLSRTGVADDRIVDGGYLYGIYILFLNEDELEFGDTLTVSTSTISEDYYRYLVEAQTELRPKNPLFSGPPANVKSNISNGALGYFAVYSSFFSTSIVREIE